MIIVVSVQTGARAQGVGRTEPSHHAREVSVITKIPLAAAEAGIGSRVVPVGPKVATAISVIAETSPACTERRRRQAAVLGGRGQGRHLLRV